MKTKIVFLVLILFLSCCPLAMAVIVSIPNGLSASPEQIDLKIPVNVRGLTGERAVQLVLKYDVEVLQAQGIDRQNTITQGDLDLVPEIEIIPGQIEISLIKMSGFNRSRIIIVNKRQFTAWGKLKKL